MPVVTGGGSGRPLPSDRNATPEDLFYRGSVAPHARVERVTYTVPAGRRAVLQSFYGLIYRNLAPTVAGTASVWCGIARSGSADNDMYEVTGSFSVAGGETHVAVPVQAELFAGDTVAIDTADTSSGGTHILTASAVIMEYDA